MTYKKIILYLLLMAVSMIPGYFLVRYGLHFTDEPYQIMNTMDIHRSPLAPLTSCFGNIIGEVTNYSWLSFRYLAVTLNNLAIVIAGIYLYLKTKSISTTSITCSIAILLSGLSRSYHNLFGWDIFTAFFIVVLIVCVLLFIENPTFTRLIAITVISVITSMVRIPNIVCFPLNLGLLSLMAYNSHFKSSKVVSYKFIFIYVALFVILLYCGLCWLYGSIQIYNNDIQSNTLPAHSLERLISVYINSFTRYSLSIMAFGMMIIILNKLRNKGLIDKSRGKLKLWNLLNVCAVIWISMILYYTPKVLSVREYDVVWIMLALLYLICAFYISGSYRSYLSVGAILIFGSICFIGSNTGFIKFPGLLLVPISTSFLFFRCNRSTIKIFAIIAVIPMLVVDALTLPYIAFQDQGIKYSDTMVREGRAAGLYTSSQRVSVVEDLEDLNRENSLQKIVVGEKTERFLYEYILDCTNVYLPHDWSGEPTLDSNEYIEWLQNRMSGMDNFAIVYIKREDGAPSLMKDYLDNNFNIISDKKTFMVYSPCQ